MPGDKAHACCVVLCHRQAVGCCPHSRLPVCSSHLQRANEQVQRLSEQVSESIKQSLGSLEQMRLCERRLEADELELATIFDEFYARIGSWRRHVVSCMHQRLQIVETQKRAWEDVGVFESSADEAADGADWSRVFRLLLQVEPSVAYLEAHDQDPESTEHTVEQEAATSLRSVQQGSQITKSSIREFLTSVHFFKQPDTVSEPMSLKLADRVWRIALCSNTGGFAFSSELGIVSDQVPPSAAGWQPLPSLCVVLCYHPDVSADHLLMVSVDPAASMSVKLKPQIRWTSQIYSLRCDNEHQQLLLAQGRAGITVADISGRVLKRLTAGSLDLPSVKFTGLCCSPDTLFALNYSKQTILAISRTTWSVQRTLDVSDLYSPSFFTESLCWRRGGLLLTDWSGRLLRRISESTGRLLATYPTAAASSGIKGPYDVVADSQGRLYVADAAKHVVWVLDPDGGFVGAFGAVGEPGETDGHFAIPVSIAVWEDPGSSAATWLLVAHGTSGSVRVLRVDF